MIDFTHRRVIQMTEMLERVIRSGDVNAEARDYLLGAIRSDIFQEKPLVLPLLQARIASSPESLRALARLTELVLHIHPLPDREVHLFALPICVDVTKTGATVFIFPRLQDGANGRIAAVLKRATTAINVEVAAALSTGEDILGAAPAAFRDFALMLEAGNAAASLGDSRPVIPGYTSHASIVYLTAAITLPTGHALGIDAALRIALRDAIEPIMRKDALKFLLTDSGGGTLPGIATELLEVDYARIAAEKGIRHLQRKHLSRMLRSVTLDDEPLELWYSAQPGGPTAIAATGRHTSATWTWRTPDWDVDPNIRRELLLALCEAEIPVTIPTQLEPNQFKQKFGCLV